MAKPVSQSRTMWVKKGTIVNGEKVKKGYVAQYGKPEKRVTGKVRLEVETPKRGKAGDVVRLKQGRYVQPGGSASKPGRRNVSPATSSGRGNDQMAAKNVKAAARPQAGYQAGAGMKRVGDRRATSGTVSAAVAQGNRQGATKTGIGGGYVRGGAAGIKGSGREKQEMARRKKQREMDTRNQGRNALGVAGMAAAIPAVALGAGAGLAGLGARSVGSLVGSGARQGVAAAGRSLAGQQQGTRAGAAAAKAATKPKPRPGQVGGVKPPKGAATAKKTTPAKKTAKKTTPAKKAAKKTVKKAAKGK